MPAAPGDQAGATRRLLPPSRILIPALLHWGTELRPGQLQGGDAATELKVGTSRAALWRDPVPASGTPGSARGRGPGAFCGCLGSRERPPGGEGCAHAAAVWSSPGSSRGVPGTQSALSGGAPESILTLHAGFLGSPREEFGCRVVFHLLVHCLQARDAAPPPVGLIKSFISYELSEGLWTAYLVRSCSMARPWGQLNGRGPQHLVGKLGVSLASGYPCLSGPALLLGVNRKETNALIP